MLLIESKVIKEEIYRNILIRTIQHKDNYIFWNIYKDNRLYLSDTRTIDGSKINGHSHALNDAKNNIDVILRFDFIKYYSKENPQ